MASIQNASAISEARPTANFRPSIWGNHFLTYAMTSNETTNEAAAEKQYEELKDKVRRMLISTEDKLSQKLILIDAMERLGVSYHFYKEIEDVLERIFHATNGDDECNDLHSLALQFRLLRQHGFDVSCDVFTKFKSHKGNFKEAIISDIEGMLSLYEASHLRLHGETILDQALAFTTTHLKSKVTTTSHVSSSLATQVRRALEWPIQKSYPRQHARNLISIFQEDGSHNEALLKFAKLDFHKLQALYQKELAYLSKWWNDSNFERKFPYARNRIVELYFWVIAMSFEPQYHFGRRFTTKAVTVISIINDTFDAFGTFEEINLFMGAVERWDVSAADQLPEFMKDLYAALLEVYDEIELETTKDGRPYCAYYAKESMKGVARAYFAKAKWYHEGYVPPVEEYMVNELTSIAILALVMTTEVGLGNLATKDALDWLISDPPIQRAASAIVRLMNDIASHKFEQERGHAASVVECYIKEHNSSEQEAYAWVKNEVEEAWKEINKGCLRPTPAPMSFLMPIINAARFANFAYNKDDGYTFVSQHYVDDITAVLVDPLPI